MSQFTIGMGDGRNSSRVLKPPGGGHSQIFGFNKEDDAPKKIHQKTEISSCFMHQSNETNGTETSSTTTEVIEEMEKQDQIKTNGNGVENGANGKSEENGVKGHNGDKIAEEKNDVNETKTDDTPQRKRVPPGGYSAGFW